MSLKTDFQIIQTRIDLYVGISTKHYSVAEVVLILSENKFQKMFQKYSKFSDKPPF